MATMLDKVNQFVAACHAEGYTSPVSRSQLKAIRAKYGIPMPAWLQKDDSRRAGPGRYHCPELNGTVHTVNVPALAAETLVEAVASVEATKMAVRTIKHTSGEIGGDSLVPTKDKLYVAYGHFKDVETIVASTKFYPIYVTGLSGNGKTTMVEQVCARLGRECIRVNIVGTTDEDDLLGGFRLINGDTVWQDGPVVLAMKRGAVLLLDEVDLGTDKMMCLQPVLEGKGVYLKKVNEKVVPAVGFTVIATANTKGQGGEHSDRFAGTRIMNEAFLERFKITLEQEYPSKVQERKIVLNLMDSYECRDEKFADNLTKWSEIVRKTFLEGALDDMITTRRLCHIVDNFAIFGDKVKAIKQTIARFSTDTREAFLNLYSKIDAEINLDAVLPVVDANGIAIDPKNRFDLKAGYSHCREELKAAGASWDPETKVWYISGEIFIKDIPFWQKFSPWCSTAAVNTPDPVAAPF